MRQGVFAFSLVLILAAGCTPAATSTMVPPTDTLAPPPTPTRTAAPAPPKSGEWSETADRLGKLTFNVSDDAAQIMLVSVDFAQFACQDRGIEGEWHPSKFSGAIRDRQFTLNGILAGYMDLSMTGQSPGVTEFPEFTFSGRFDDTGKAGGTWEVQWARASCSGTWGSGESRIDTGGPAPTETLLAPIASPEPVFLDPFCNCEAEVSAGGAAYLSWGWIAAEEAFVRDFVFASQTTVIIDGTSYTGLEMYWGGTEYSAEDDGYRSAWTYLLPSLGQGKHHVEMRLSLSRRVTDGYDVDDDGQLDQYGPGETFSGWVDIRVTARAAATQESGVCPNGSPKGTWELIVDMTQPGDGTITIDGEATLIHSGENIFYLAVGKSHPVVAGTNTFNMSGPECGENSLEVP